MLAPLLALVLACCSGHAAAQAFTRANEGECLSPGESVNLVELVSALEGTVACTETASCDLNVLDAIDFKIQYFPGFKIVTNTLVSPPFASVLYPCGTERPDDPMFDDLRTGGTGVGFFEIPLTAVGTDDSTAGWALTLLDVRDRVRFASPRATEPCLQKVSAPPSAPFGGCGRPFISPSNFDGLEATPAAQYDGEFLFSAADETLKQIPFTAAADPLPLARAEHIIYAAAFFNKEADASRIYAEIVRDYNAAKRPTRKNAPVVLWAERQEFLFGFTRQDGTPISGGGFIFSYSTFKTELVADAGARSLPVAEVAAAATDDSVRAADSDARGRQIAFADSVFDSRAELLAAMLPLLQRVDVLIDEQFFNAESRDQISLDTFLETWGIPQSDVHLYPFLRNGALYRHDKQRTADGADDWFGQAIIRPAVVLEDIVAVTSVKAGVLRKCLETVYLRNIALGEDVEITTGADCDDLTCDAFANQAPLPIEQLVAEAEMMDGEVPDADGGPAPPVGDGGGGGAGMARRRLGRGTKASRFCALVRKLVLKKGGKGGGKVTVKKGGGKRGGGKKRGAGKFVKKQRKGGFGKRRGGGSKKRGASFSAVRG